MTTQIGSEEIEHFSRLFTGYENAYGIYEINHQDADGKRTGLVKTIPRAATNEDYRLHLSGVTGIGIVPLLKDDRCWFGAIDLDIKGDTKLTEDHFILEARIRALNLPLLLCKSKSNGAHLYLFGSEPISARLIQARLTEFAALLGYGGCEVFPKQIMRLKETDCGNWINLPYFGEERFAIHEGKQRSLKEFIKIAKFISVSNDHLRAFKIQLSEQFADGPPCLQQLCTVGFGQGSRNNALFNVAVYFKKKFPDAWQDKVYAFNNEHMQPPLSNSEVMETCRSAGKKDYNFTCKQAPIVSYCNRKLCKTRDYGVSGGEEASAKLPIQSITKYIAGDSVRYGINTGEIMIEFSEDEFFNIDAYRKKFAAHLSFCLPPVKQDGFFKQMDELLKNCETVIDPEDASEQGTLIDAFESWFLGKAGAINPDEMVKDKWWHDAENNKIYFKKEALTRYLSRHKDIKKVEPHKMFRLLKQKYGIEEDRLAIKGDRVRVWKMTHFDFTSPAPLEVPKGIQPKEVL